MVNKCPPHVESKSVLVKRPLPTGGLAARFAELMVGFFFILFIWSALLGLFCVFVVGGFNCDVFLSFEHFQPFLGLERMSGFSFFDEGLFRQEPSRAFAPPSFQSFFGRDALGRQFSYRLFWAMGQSLLTCFLGNIIAFAIATLLAVTENLYPKTRWWLHGLSDLGLSLPRLILFILLFYSLSTVPSLSTLGYFWISCVSFGLFSWMSVFRFLSPMLAETLSRDYVLSGYVMGQRFPRLLFQEVLPNMSDSLTRLFVFRWASLLFFEGFLGFIGLGPQAPYISWGALISEGLHYGELGAHLLLFPSIFFVLFIGSVLVLFKPAPPVSN